MEHDVHGRYGADTRAKKGVFVLHLDQLGSTVKRLDLVDDDATVLGSRELPTMKSEVPVLGNVTG